MGERYVGKIGSDQTARNTATKIRKRTTYAIKRQVRSSVRKTGLVKIAPCIAEKMIVELAIEIQEGSAANRIGLGRTVKRFAKKMGRRMAISIVAKTMVQKFAIRIGTERIAQNSVKCQMISTQENTFATTKRGEDLSERLVRSKLQHMLQGRR